MSVRSLTLHALVIITTSCAYAQNAAAPTPAAAAASTTSSAVILNGRSFSSPAFNPPHFEAGNMQLLSHYGKLVAKADLNKPASKVRIHLKPRIMDGSQPVVGLLLERRAGGKYVSIPVMKEEPVKDAAEIVKDVAIEPGIYDVTLQFFKSTGPQRTHLEIHKIIFE